MAHHDISPDLLVRFKRAVKELSQKVTAIPDSTVDEDLRKWLDGQDGPRLSWQNDRGVTPDEYFFITTLYGNMNLEGQRTMIRKYFGPLFVLAAERKICNFRPDMKGYQGLRSNWMKGRLCRMGALLREQGISMAEYVGELRSLEKKAIAANPTPALDRIVQDHQATGIKTLSVFVRDCVGGNCFPIDLRVRRQLEKYQLPLDEKLLVRICIELRHNPRQLARTFYEAEFEGIDAIPYLGLDVLEPSVFSSLGRHGWSSALCGKLIRQPDALQFNVLDGHKIDWTCKMTLDQKDGLYHWRAEERLGHWWGFLSETPTHTYLAANCINPDKEQGVQIFVWPKR
jgi:hypothetical protein